MVTAQISLNLRNVHMSKNKNSSPLAKQWHMKGKLISKHTKTKARLKIEDTLYLISGINCAIVIIPQVPSIFADLEIQ